MTKQQKQTSVGKMDQRDHFESQPFCSPEAVAQFRTLPFTERENMVQTGITKDQLVQLRDVLNVDYYTLGELLAVTDRTLHLKKGNERFSPILSDRIVALAELYSYGFTVFEDAVLFRSWIAAPNRDLDRRTPLEVIATYPGLGAVHETLNKIYYGQL